MQGSRFAVALQSLHVAGSKKIFSTISKRLMNSTHFFLSFQNNSDFGRNKKSKKCWMQGSWHASCWVICSWCTRLEHKPRNYLLSSHPFCMDIWCNKSFIRRFVLCGHFYIQSIICDSKYVFTSENDQGCGAILECKSVFVTQNVTQDRTYNCPHIYSDGHLMLQVIHHPTNTIQTSGHYRSLI